MESGATTLWDGKNEAIGFLSKFIFLTEDDKVLNYEFNLRYDDYLRQEHKRGINTVLLEVLGLDPIIGDCEIKNVPVRVEIIDGVVTDFGNATEEIWFSDIYI